jgi:hypothetical protein
VELGAKKGMWTYAVAFKKKIIIRVIKKENLTDQTVIPTIFTVSPCILIH